MGPHQAAASARAGHVLQDRQPTAVLRSYTEAQAPEVDVARRRIHAQAGAVLPGRLRRGGPRVQALHGCAQGGPPSLRASSQSPAPLLAARPRLSRVRCPLSDLARQAPLQRHPACPAPVTPGSLPGSSNLDCLGACFGAPSRACWWILIALKSSSSCGCPAQCCLLPGLAAICQEGGHGGARTDRPRA